MAAGKDAAQLSADGAVLAGLQCGAVPGGRWGWGQMGGW